MSNKPASVRTSRPLSVQWAGVCVTLALTMMAACSSPRSIQQSGNGFSIRPVAMVSVPFTLDHGPFTLMRVHNGLTYLAPQQKPDSGRYVIYAFDERRLVDSIVLRFPDDPSLHPRGTVQDFDVGDSNVVVLFFGAVLTYGRSADGVYRRPSITSVPRYYEFVAIASDTILLGACDPQAQTLIDHPCWVGRLTLNGRLPLDSFKLPVPDGLQFAAFQPRKFFSLDSRGLLVSDVTRYRVLLCDTKGRVIDSFARSDGPWANLLDTGYRKVRWAANPARVNGKALLDSLRPYLSRLPMIRFVDWVADDAVLVVWQGLGLFDDGLSKGQPLIYFDLWKRSSGKWSLVDKDLADFNPLLEHFMSVEGGMLPLGMSVRAGSDMTLLRLQSLPPGPLDSLTYGGMNRRREAYIRENGPAYRLVRYGIFMKGEREVTK